MTKPIPVTKTIDYGNLMHRAMRGVDVCAPMSGCDQAQPARACSMSAMAVLSFCDVSSDAAATSLAD